MGGLKEVRIVVVGPTDVNPEKDLVDAIVMRMADGARKKGFALLPPRRWERLDPRASPEGVQLGIENDLRIEDCDVIIAILWKTYGKLDETDYSPTAREIRKALAANRASGGRRPAVKVYFSNRFFPPTDEDTREHERVLRFKTEISDQARYRDYARPQIRDYDNAETFGSLIRDDLGNLVDDLALADRKWSCSAASTPVPTRHEGYTEPVSDIRVTVRGPGVSGGSGKVTLQVKVSLDTSLSCREFADGTTLDVTLTAEMNGGSWRGMSNRPQTNAVMFGPFSRAALDSGFAETFVIRGIRVDSTCVHSIGALVEVTISDDVGVPLATARASVDLAISVKSTFFTALVESVPIAGLSEDSIAHSVVISFQRAFPGTFKTMQEEAGYRDRGAVYGSILAAALSNLPPGWEVYATLFDLSFKKTGGRAVATKVGPEGLPQGRRSTPGKLFWDGLIPLEQIARGEDIAWEVICPEWDATMELASWDFDYSRWRPTEDLVFGVVLVGSKDLPRLKSTVCLSGCRAPWFAPSTATRTSSATLPIPRFARVNPPWALPFS